jgi:hypothetical protein
VTTNLWTMVLLFFCYIERTKGGHIHILFAECEDVVQVYKYRHHGAAAAKWRRFSSVDAFDFLFLLDEHTAAAAADVIQQHHSAWLCDIGRILVGNNNKPKTIITTRRRWWWYNFSTSTYTPCFCLGVVVMIVDCYDSRHVVNIVKTFLG